MAWGRLALIQGADDADVLDKLADVFGYVKIPEQAIDISTNGAGFTTISNTAEVEDVKPIRPPARFLRINKIIKTETDPSDHAKPGYLSDPNKRLQAASGTYRFAPPPPILPKARLLPMLFNSLAQARDSHRLDYQALITRLAQGKPLQRLPKRQQPRWPQRVQILVDASRRLEPYWVDFEAIVQQLTALLGEEAVDAIRFDDNTLGESVCYCLPWPSPEHEPWRVWRTPPPDVALLILSDLGEGDYRASVAWRRQLTALQLHPSPILTLSPAIASSDDNAFCQQFGLTPVNDAYPMPRHPLRNGFCFQQPSADAVEDILAWLSALPLIDAGLLRRLRIAMQWGDSAIETIIWQHPAVRNLGIGICLQAHLVEAYQQRFEQRFAGSKQAQQFWAIVEDHHKDAYQGLRYLEQFKQSIFEPNNPPKDVDHMREYFESLCAMTMQSMSNPAQQHALRVQCRTVLASLPESVWKTDINAPIYSLFAAAYEDDIRAKRWPERMPNGFDPSKLRWLTGETHTEPSTQTWQVIQLNDQGQLRVEPCRSDNAVATPLVKTDIANDVPLSLIMSDVNGQTTQLLQQGMTVTLSDTMTVVLAARGLTIELESILRPSWASRIWQDAQGLTCSMPWLQQELAVTWLVSTTQANGTWRWPTPFGEDDFGVYVDVSINQVTQRFRWINPGVFWMGSPEDELEREWRGRKDGKDTETLHHVTLTQGFWLADTAVTQRFWLAVMGGDNPSRFKDNLENPVEQVSWQDAQRFITRLNDLIPGLSARLPSEAQWEYACRAGTTTPFSFGDNITPEQVNYHGDYPYANGQKGLYRGQTVPVKSLPVNPWGLYEMHGNVWEWCADAWQQQMSAQPVTDPLMMSEDRDAPRVLRGGSWGSDGGFVRSAFRNRFTPDDRNISLGFRLALGHELKSSQVATGIGAGRRVAEQRQNAPVPVAGLLNRFFNKTNKGDKKKK